MKKFLPRILFALLCAAIVILPLLPRAEAEKYTYAKALYFEHGNNSNGEHKMTFFTPEGEICRFPMGAGSFYIDMALDRSYAFLILNLNEEDGGELHFISPEGTKHIADGVYAILSSDSGGSAAYITDFSEDSETCRLMYYNGKTGEAECIEDRLWSSNSIWYNHAALSPDGRTLVYCRYVDGAPEGILWNRGKYTSLGNALPIAVADGGKYIYYSRSDTEDYTRHSYLNYYVLSKKGEQLISTYPVNGNFYFNRDFSETLFFGHDENTSYAYFCIDGISVPIPEELPAAIKSIAAPAGELAGEYAYWDITKFPRPEYYTRFGIDSFRSKTLLYQTSEGWCGNSYVYPVYYVDSEWQILGPYDYGSNSFSTNGKNAIYTLGYELYYIENYPEDEPVHIGMSNGEVLGSREGQIYYISGYDLWLWDNGESRKIAENALLPDIWLSPGRNRSIANSFDFLQTSVPPLNGYLYFTRWDRDTLHCITPEGSIEPIAAEKLKDATSIYVNYNEGIPLLVLHVRNEGIFVYRLDGSSATLIVDTSRH